MSKLQISVNQREARGNAWFMTILITFLASGLVYVALTTKFVSGGLVVDLFLVALIVWIFLSLVFSTHRLFRLSRFEGTLLEITPEGLTDFWTDPARFIPWEDVKYTEWRNVKYTVVFRIVMKQQSFSTSLRSIFGLPGLEFPKQYLSPPANEIAQFMLDNVPNEILR